MKNHTVKKGMKIGATIGGLEFLAFGIVPACSSAVSIVVGTLLATILGVMWFPSARRLER